MKNIRLFFATMFSEWGSGLSGPASVPFTVLALFASGAVQKTAYAVLAVLLALFSAYRIWLKGHLELEKEQTRNQRPELRGEIDQVFIGRSVDADGITPVDGAVVLLAVKAWNTIQMPEFGIDKYDLMITIDGPTGPYSLEGTQGEWTINMKANDSFRVTHMSRDRLRPMRYIDPQHGAVGFYVKGLSPDTTAFKSITLSLIDATNGKHPVTLLNGKFTPDGIIGQRAPIA